MILHRSQLDRVRHFFRPNKVLLLIGPRRVGKTILLRQFISTLDEPYLLLNGEAADTKAVLERRTVSNYRQLLGDKKVLIIDEAQKIPEIGWVLKLIVDEIPGIKVLATGSSAFDMNNELGEPLTGRKYTLELHPLSERELSQVDTILTLRDNFTQRLIYGNYPELIQLPNNDEKKIYLRELIETYLLKDILAFEGIQMSNKIFSLLQLIAFQIGSEISYSEIGRQLSMDKKTVERYLDLLSKVFIIHRVGALSRNLRKEISKGKRWYFYDNGIRNALINNFSPLSLRQDVGQLWENYIISERLKYQAYRPLLSYNFFWRTYDQQEIDWIEDRDGILYSYEFKFNPNKTAKKPIAFDKAYPNSEFKVINADNFVDWIDKWPNEGHQ